MPGRPQYQYQYIAEAGPVRVPLPAFRDAWFPEYPDILAPAPRQAVLPVQQHPAFFYGTFVTPLARFRDAWLPVYPDFARAAARAVEYPAEFWTPFKLPVVPMSWSPAYEDLIIRAPRIPAEGWTVESFFAVLRPPAPPLSWSPTYADFARGAQRPIAEGRWDFGSWVLPLVPLSWGAKYPDFAPGPRRPVPEGAWAFDSWNFKPPFGWPATYPDFARSALRPVAEGLWSFASWVLPQPAYSWAPEYPDLWLHARPLTPEGAYASSFFATFPVVAPSFAWWLQSTDFARGRPPSPEGGLTESVRFGAPPLLSWHPEYPAHFASAVAARRLILSPDTAYVVGAVVPTPPSGPSDQRNERRRWNWHRSFTIP